MTRTAELIEYITMLERLQKSGFSCMKELKVALEELHNNMFPVKEIVKGKVEIIILEENFGGVINSMAVFEKIMPKEHTFHRHNDDVKLLSDDLSVKIFKVVNSERVDHFRGMKANYVINNTPHQNINDYIKVKTV